MELVGASTMQNVEVVVDCDVWRLNLELLPPQPSWTRGVLKEEDNHSTY